MKALYRCLLAINVFFIVWLLLLWILKYIFLYMGYINYLTFYYSAIIEVLLVASLIVGILVLVFKKITRPLGISIIVSSLIGVAMYNTDFAQTLYIDLPISPSTDIEVLLEKE